MRSPRFLCVVSGLAASVVATPCLAQASEPELPQQIRLEGVVRDFRPFNEPNGHPDFQQYNTGHRVGWVATELDEDGKPQLEGGQGKKVTKQAEDAGGVQIFPRISEVDYMDARSGDKSASMKSESSKVVTSEESFFSWYRDVHGVNLSKNVELVLELDPETERYVFHQHDDMSTGAIEGFFPIDDQLYGNPIHDEWGHNYHFTFEMETSFVYKKGSGQMFTFFGDDDVWVFIDGKMVIDLGGVHGAVSQSVQLDRLNWLRDGHSYSLKLFFAERHFTRSNCRIETNLHLQTSFRGLADLLHD